MRISIITRTRNEEDLIEVFLLNRSYADEIIVVDSESTDRTVELAQKNPLVKVKHYLGGSIHPDVYFSDEGACKNIGVEAATGDWIEFADVDEMANLDMQAGIHEYLETADPWAVVAIPFLYLCPGFDQYYTEPSQWPVPRIWHRSLHPHSTEQLGGSIPVPASQVTPDNFMLIHLNWALTKRFAQKRPIYEAVFGHPSWHPDEKYPERAFIPEQAIWRINSNHLQHGSHTWEEHE